jgi:hypothetical protein
MITPEQLIDGYYRKYGRVNTVKMWHEHDHNFIQILQPSGQGLEVAIPHMNWQKSHQEAFDTAVDLIHGKFAIGGLNGHK